MNNYLDPENWIELTEAFIAENNFRYYKIRVQLFIPPNEDQDYTYARFDTRIVGEGGLDWLKGLCGATHFRTSNGPKDWLKEFLEKQDRIEMVDEFYSRRRV